MFYRQCRKNGFLLRTPFSRVVGNGFSNLRPSCPILWILTTVMDGWIPKSITGFKRQRPNGVLHTSQTTIRGQRKENPQEGQGTKPQRNRFCRDFLKVGGFRSKPLESWLGKDSVRARSWKSGFLFFEPPDFFADFVVGLFLLIFVGEGARKILQENSRQNPPELVQQNPRRISAEGPGQIL